MSEKIDNQKIITDLKNVEKYINHHLIEVVEKDITMDKFFFYLNIGSQIRTIIKQMAEAKE